MILNPGKPKTLGAAVRRSLVVPATLLALGAGCVGLVQLFTVASPSPQQSWHFQTIEGK